MKNNCCLFERLLKKIRMAFSFLEHLFWFRDDILCDDIIRFATKIVKY